MSHLERISLQPIPSGVARLNDWLDSAIARSDIKRSIAADLKLCVNEAVANLINYGFNTTVEPSIIIDVKLEPSRGTAVIIDNGAFFDMRQWPVPDKPKDLMTANPGGYGVLLIRQRASDLDYVRDGASNKLTIVCSTINP
jgi:serine/threonine-protein kinase RsbW